MSINIFFCLFDYFIIKILLYLQKMFSAIHIQNFISFKYLNTDFEINCAIICFRKLNEKHLYNKIHCYLIYVNIT